MMQNQINIRYGISEIKALAAEIESKHFSSLFILVDSNTEAQCLTRFLELCPVVPTAVLKMKEGEANKNLKPAKHYGSSSQKKVLIAIVY